MYFINSFFTRMIFKFFAALMDWSAIIIDSNRFVYLSFYTKLFSEYFFLCIYLYLYSPIFIYLSFLYQSLYIYPSICGGQTEATVQWLCVKTGSRIDIFPPGFHLTIRTLNFSKILTIFKYLLSYIFHHVLLKIFIKSTKQRIGV